MLLATSGASQDEQISIKSTQKLRKNSLYQHTRIYACTRTKVPLIARCEHLMGFGSIGVFFWQ